LTRPTGSTRYRIARATAAAAGLALLPVAPVRAQSPPPATVGFEETFRRLDGNGDGILDANEAGALGFFNRADTNGDGRVTGDEARRVAAKSGTAPASGSRRTAGMEGDGAAPVFHWPVAPVRIAETESPVLVIEATAADGRATRAWWRKPPGDGPFPAILFIHGGLTEFPEASLRQHLTDNPVMTRLLAAGYAVVMATFRSYEEDVQSRGPIEDVRAVLRQTAKLSGVDPRRIAVYGGSGGGSIALELGSDPEVRAVVAGEPATVLYTGMLTTGDYGPRLEMMADPETFFTPELRVRTLEKLKTIRAPVLILHGDRHDLHKLNKPLFLPLMKEAGVKVEYREYPGYGHGFYFGGGDDRWGKGADEAVVAGVIRDVRSFLDREMPPAEVALEPANGPDWVTRAVTAPNVAFHTFRSAAAKSEVGFHVYTPAVYGTEKERRFPVLYWLHGTGGGLAGIAPLSAWFDAAIRDGKIPPMLVVFPNGLPASLWCDSSDGERPVETILIRELIPHLDGTYRTIASREGRILEGFSMGGFGAARLGFRYPDLFCAVSILAGGPLDLDFSGPRATANPAERERILDRTFGGDLDRYRAVHPLTVAEQHADAVRGRVRVRLAVGSLDFTEPLNRAYSAHLGKLAIDHTFTVVPGVDHDTLALLRGLGEANWQFYGFFAATAGSVGEVPEP
jgi:acetyl esterase/lipase